MQLHKEFSNLNILQPTFLSHSGTYGFGMDWLGLAFISHSRTYTKEAIWGILPRQSTRELSDTYDVS
jgi:hypothetical protein